MVLLVSGVMRRSHSVSNMVYERTKCVDAGQDGPLVAEVALALYLCRLSNGAWCQEFNEAHFLGGADIA
jgi:hypothetical protein